MYHVGEVPWNKGKRPGTTPTQKAQLDRLHRSMRGRKRSPEYLARLRARLRPDPEVTYKSIHQRLRRVLPRICAHCGETAGRLEVALIHGPHVGLRCATTTAPHPRMCYATNAKAYMRLCTPCHRRYDHSED